MNTATLGLAIIARDEEGTLPHLLASISGAFDQVALLDTGSEDQTVAVFERWAACQCFPLGYKVDHFEWCDDFAAARNGAEALLETDWLCWADADDEIVGGERLRKVIADTREREPEVVGFAFDYALIGTDGRLVAPTPREGGPRFTAPDGRAVSHMPARTRLYRRGLGEWSGRLHESIDFDGEFVPGRFMRVPPEIARWQHRRRGDRPTSLDRNARILSRWVEEEPDNLRPLGMLAAAALMDGDRNAGMRYFTRYVELRHANPADGVALTERETANWAFHVLERACEVCSPDQAEEFFPLLVTLLLSREPSGWMSSGIKCAEASSPPAGAAVPPMTRQQRRAEARRQAKELLRQ